MKDLINDRDAWDGFLGIIANTAAESHAEASTTVVTGRILVRRHPVTYVDFAPKLGLIFIDGGFDGGPVQEKFLAVMRAVAIAGQAVACVTTAEVWMTRDPHNRPSEADDRHEGVILAAEHVNFGPTTRIARIVAEAGNRRCLPWGAGQGQLMRILGPQPPSDAIAAAHALLASLTSRGALSMTYVNLDDFN